MLKLQSIKKDYVTANETVHALKGLDIEFRANEFVSILGPSGCGKTTLLNIIGGLDHYTDGDLFIDGVSTKSFKDRDWDTYRNHRIGFIFQSYNLIPHQTILENVELALTISGVDKAARVAKAKDALDKVGLKGQYNKKPNQLSGGQCQRVAIARALVNEPEILLADEPTGALDTTTSVQIMELIKEIAKERLVIMVTHNPEIAEKYSTRIVKLLDGNIVSDSDPYTSTPEDDKDRPHKEISKKSKLSFWQAFRLSARNLRSKFKRTLMVCLAGSIGIIGVATVLAVRSGVLGYISDMQDDMLSGNPITISEEALDLSSVMSAMTMGEQAEASKIAVEDGKINVSSVIEYLVSRADSAETMTITNDITQEYIDFVNAMPKEYYSAIVPYYGVSMSNNLFTDFHFADKNGETGTQIMSLTAGRQTYTALLEQTDYKQYSSMITSFATGFSQMPNNIDFVLSQYDILNEGGHIPTKANEIMIVVNGDHELSDLTLAQLGYYSQKEFFNAVYKAADRDDLVDESIPDIKQFTYEELLSKKFTWYPNDTVYKKNPGTSLRPQNQYPFDYNHKIADGETWEGGKELTLTAILRPKEGTSYGCLSSGFYFTTAFTEEVLESGRASEIVKYINEDLPDDQDKTITSGFYQTAMPGTGEMIEFPYGITYRYDFWWDGSDLSPDEYWHTGNVGFIGSSSSMAAILGTMMNLPYANVHTFTLRQAGGATLPNNISIYPVNFELKDEVTKYLDLWNAKDENGNKSDLEVGDLTLKASRSDVTYTDNLSIIIAMISDMINIVSIALVAFTALSLVVSTVMIAIITYVSVIERVKEIGVIRSLGGRKGDVSRLFNAETFIIGLISGLVGIAITYIIEGIVNLCIGAAFGIYSIASLSIPTALIMIAISIALTLVSGLIPARLAAKKDPVDALRSE